MTDLTGYTEWCEANQTAHGHCPCDCEHPQPFMADGKLICGKCWFDDGVACEMIPCTPDNC